MKELGYGHAYRYAHDEPDAYAAGETYLPEGVPEPHWYRPVPRGVEAKIADKLAQLRRRDEAARRGEASASGGADGAPGADGAGDDA
jgi:putative ATPase